MRTVSCVNNRVPAGEKKYICGKEKSGTGVCREREKPTEAGGEKKGQSGEGGFRDALRRAREGDRDARDALVQQNVGLVWSIVRRFLNRGYEAEDLFQVGCIGLIKAIDRFDLSYEVRFSTYAVPLITGEIRRFLRDDGMLKVSRTLKQNASIVNRAAEQWRSICDREATLEELSAQTGLSAEDIVLALSAGTEVDSLYRRVPGSEGREMTLQEQIRDEKNEIETRINHVFLEQALAVLTKEERQLISLRYFHGKTQTETAKLLGMTQVQVSRKEKQLLLKMRALV